MKTNVGTIDRVIRILAALLFAVLYFTGTVSGTLGIVLLTLGGIFLATSFFSFCPIYFGLGINSIPKNK